MPYKIAKNAGDCDGYAVVNSDTGDVKGCHETQDQAKAQLAALYANTDEGKSHDTLMDPVPVKIPPTLYP